jgi:flavin reductase (DIM6/NTAB) family NADH-FMN oxidoreductase RutF
MERKDIPVNELLLHPFDVWNNNWALLSSGDFAAREFNCMTISWGSLGYMWNKPFAMVVVRPQRYTRKFIDASDSFTLSVFPEQYKETLETLGSTSGREMDKVNASGFTPQSSSRVASPSFLEAELTIECSKMYFDDYEPDNFLADFIEDLYEDDYHRMYFGQVLAVSGIAKYRRSPLS